jgi:putative membrane-bound dehydrogenase-like protein
MRSADLTKLLVVLLALCPPAGADDDLARELPRIKPLEPAAALKSFRVHQGFHLEPVAVEPLVTDPVSVCYDADGRLYVVEMRGYPYPEQKPSGYVTRLEDHDGDGRFDSRTIFVDGLSWPTGIVPYDGGVFIAVAPEILYAKDTNGDGVADIKKVMFTGFVTENVQGLLNGLLWGPDGWIYGVTSSNGGEIRNLARPASKPVSVRGRDFRFRPDGSAFEAVSGGGQFGHAFDDWGHRFTCSNSNHIRQIVMAAADLERNPALIAPAVVADIAAEGPAAPVFRISAAEPWRVVRTRQRAADPEMRKRLPPTELFAIGFFTSATGVTIYRGSAYPPEYRGNAFVGDVGGNLIHRKTLAVHGASYLAKRADNNVEFLASTDNWFRPVNFANTPDGTLLILDMYRETIEHPWSIPEPIKRHLDLTSGKDRGRLYELVYEERSRRGHRRPRLSRAATAELVPLLADPDAWWRETAQRLLLERRDPAAVPLLRALVSRRPTALGRLHALWTLDDLGELQIPDLLLGLSDAEPRVLEQAIRLTAPRITADRDLLAPVITRADHPDPMVRFQVALALGAVNREPGVIDALAGIAVRDSDDPWMRTAVLTSVSKRASALLAMLAGRADFLASGSAQAWLDELATLVGAEHDPAQVRQLITQLIRSGDQPDLPTRVMVALGRGLRRSGSSLSAVLAGDEVAIMEPLVQAAARDVGSEVPLDRKRSAIALLGMSRAGKAMELLPELLDGRQPVAIQLAVLQTLGDVNDPAVGRSIVEHWRSMSPAVRREAAEILFSRRARVEHLLDAIESKALAATEIDPERLRRLRSHPDERLRARALKVLGAESTSTRDRGAVLTAYRPALTLVGSPERGRAVFQKTCATCHRAADAGLDVGPDLATVTGRSPEDLLTHILDPNREVAPNYVNYNVATVDGRTLSGIILTESPTALTLKRAEGATDVVPRAQIEAVASTGLSLMPEGLEKGLAPGDFADLIAFVKSIPGAPPGTSPTGGR